MSRVVRLLAAALAGSALLAACDVGSSEGSADATAGTSTAAATDTAGASAAPAARIAVVTHGEAGAPFWAVVRRGIDDAARDLGVDVTYQAPDVYEADRMRQLIEAAIAARPDGLVVSLPDPDALAPALAQARAAGIPVVAINSGVDAYRDVGALLYVGQPEVAAGLEAGRRLAAAGVRNALCLNHQVGVASLVQRCRGFARGLATRGGRSRMVQIPLQDPNAAEQSIERALEAGDVDGVLTLGRGGATPALAVLRDRARADVKIATFDLAPDILDALRTGRLEFAVDQQPYLQGYLPILFLTQRAQYGLLPAAGTIVPTGPGFVTKADAERVAQLTLDGIR